MMSVTSNDHSELVAAMATGDERAAAKLYDDYSRTLYTLALRIVGERADAEEVVMEAFTQAWANASHYEHARSSVLSWLIMMTRTRALDCVRARSRRTRIVTDAVRGAGDEPLAMGGRTQIVSDQMEDAERAMAVSSAMQILAKSQRVAIELAFFKGLSHPEIALLLGEPLGTIKTRIRLGMQRLRQVLSHVTAGATMPERPARIQMVS